MSDQTIADAGAKESQPALAVKRGNVNIALSSQQPVIFTATEQVSWKTGAVQINGIGVARDQALGALEESYSRLIEVLSHAG
jgi:hypothetical protein